jgi:hypothetical protein
MKKTPKLSAEEQGLLREIVSKCLPEYAEGLLQQSPETWLAPLRTRVRDAVGEELAATGFDASCAPTARGDMLESIIDFLNRLELGPKADGSPGQ